MTASRLRGISALAAGLLVAQGIILAIILAGAARPPLRLPITLGLPGGHDRIVLFRLDLGVAGVVLCLLVASFRLLTVLPWTFSRSFSAVEHNRFALRWIEFAFSSSITVFLVAQLNGISDIGALVLSYAITSGMTLFIVLQQRSPRSMRGRMLPLWFAAAIGIVPWGVIAFHQIAALVLGQAPSVLARVITLTMLAFAFAFFFNHWREQRTVDSASPTASGERLHILLTVVSTSVFAWLVVLGAVGWGDVRL